jgi:hypothetical protein
VDHSSDEGSVKCPVCSVTFTTQEVGTPDNFHHTFCVACLQECSKSKNNYPVDRQKFNFILVRRQIGGEIYTIFPMEQAREQSGCNREDREPVGGKFTLGHVLCLAIMFGLK